MLRISGNAAARLAALHGANKISLGIGEELAQNAMDFLNTQLKSAYDQRTAQTHAPVAIAPVAAHTPAPRIGR